MTKTEFLLWLRAENAWKDAELAKLRAATGSFYEVGDWTKLAWYPDDPKFLYISTYISDCCDSRWEEEKVELDKVQDFLKQVESRPDFETEKGDK